MGEVDASLVGGETKALGEEVVDVGRGEAVHLEEGGLEAGVSLEGVVPGGVAELLCAVVEPAGGGHLFTGVWHRAAERRQRRILPRRLYRKGHPAALRGLAVL